MVGGAWCLREFFPKALSITFKLGHPVLHQRFCWLRALPCNPHPKQLEAIRLHCPSQAPKSVLLRCPMAHGSFGWFSLPWNSSPRKKQKRTKGPPLGNNHPKRKLNDLLVLSRECENEPGDSCKGSHKGFFIIRGHSPSKMNQSQTDLESQDASKRPDTGLIQKLQRATPKVDPNLTLELIDLKQFKLPNGDPRNPFGKLASRPKLRKTPTNTAQFAQVVSGTKSRNWGVARFPSPTSRESHPFHLLKPPGKPYLQLS